MKRVKKNLLRALVALAALYLVLLIPGSSDDALNLPQNKTPFAWNQDAVWLQMEQEFKAAKKMPAADMDTITGFYQKKLLHQLFALGDTMIKYNDPRLFAIEESFFHAAAYAAATPDPGWYVRSSNAFRSFVKQQSRNWDVKDTAVKNTLYKLLYGLRAATEEVLLQTNTPVDTADVLVQPERSAAPFTTIFGVKVHSGDLLVSRGGAEVSALISRGNDYPGNFSHVALIYVEEKTNRPYLIEAHIEKGVALSSVEQYVQDKKLRFMVLRLRNDLPVMQQDSLLAHYAAKVAYEAALRRHIPYDFKMNFYDSAAMFCSEVASYAYKTKGVQLWQHISTISSAGVVNWLHDFGVENFVTQMPSDLEYDPQLSIVAEWRDPGTLYKDHIDNAAMDAMLEKANQGQTISYNHWMLPVARCIKAWSWIKNRFGKEGMIPEGMNATRALKNQTFVAMHKTVREMVQQQAEAFHRQNGYRPPYWQLVKFAQDAANK
ncbi:MAG: YiiX/YebB-like N1pC/P60 family cysteine hydrolase [Ferruginibacter sp.]